MEENNIHTKFDIEERKLKYETMLEKKEFYISARKLCNLIRYLVMIPLISTSVLFTLIMGYLIAKLFII